MTMRRTRKKVQTKTPPKTRKSPCSRKRMRHLLKTPPKKMRMRHPMTCNRWKDLIMLSMAVLLETQILNRMRLCTEQLHRPVMRWPQKRMPQRRRVKKFPFFKRRTKTKMRHLLKTPPKTRKSLCSRKRMMTCKHQWKDQIMLSMAVLLETQILNRTQPCTEQLQRAVMTWPQKRMPQRRRVKNFPFFKRRRKRTRKIWTKKKAKKKMRLRRLKKRSLKKARNEQLEAVARYKYL